jgi:hypothetical protein
LAAGLVLIACSPPAEKEPPQATPVTQWQPADGPGSSALSWIADNGAITLACISKCNPAEAAKSNEPTKECTPERGTFRVVAPYPHGAAGDAATGGAVLLGEAAFSSVFTNESEELPPDHFEMSFTLDDGVIASLSSATTARVTVGDRFIAGGQDEGGLFKAFAESCRLHAGAAPQP